MRKRTRRSKLDTRVPADFVPEEHRVKVAALWWMVRNHQKTWFTIAAPLLQQLRGKMDLSEVQGRLPMYISTILDYRKVVWPRAREVAPCCWSALGGTENYKYAYLSHARSAGHLAQHFRVNAKDVIQEAKMWLVASAISQHEDE